MWAMCLIKNLRVIYVFNLTPRGKRRKNLPKTCCALFTTACLKMWAITFWFEQPASFQHDHAHGKQ